MLHNYFHLAVRVTCYHTNTYELLVLHSFGILLKMLCWLLLGLCKQIPVIACVLPPARFHAALLGKSASFPDMLVAVQC